MRIAETIASEIGEVNEVRLVGDLAHGQDSSIIDLVFFGSVKHEALVKWIEKAEAITGRKLRFTIYRSKEEASADVCNLLNESILIWKQ